MARLVARRHMRNASAGRISYRGARDLIWKMELACFRTRENRWRQQTAILARPFLFLLSLLSLSLGYMYDIYTHTYTYIRVYIVDTEPSLIIFFFFFLVCATLF